MEQASRHEPQKDPQEEDPSKQNPPRRKLWEWTRFVDKGLWDCLQLLIVPVAVVLTLGRSLNARTFCLRRAILPKGPSF